ncbi:MAG TPA: biotin/lipoyl-containing protein [Jatrophihabitans sp.]|nr:biotin/lipoyl-containing protein [Jatrophihabitans sp.]
MTQNLAARNDPYSEPFPGAESAAAADLALVRQHAVELLAQLGRPPRNLHLQAGEASVDITWDEPGSPEPADRTLLTEVRAVEVRTSEAGQPPAADLAQAYLTSPGVGVFYHSREPGAAPFVSVGSLVQPGQQIGIIEAMKLMIPVEADRTGRICQVVKGNGEPVEYAEPLFALEPEEG